MSDDNDLVPAGDCPTPRLRRLCQRQGHAVRKTSRSRRHLKSLPHSSSSRSVRLVSKAVAALELVSGSLVKMGGLPHALSKQERSCWHCSSSRSLLVHLHHHHLHVKQRQPSPLHPLPLPQPRHRSPPTCLTSGPSGIAHRTPLLRPHCHPRHHLAHSSTHKLRPLLRQPQ
jgi:hypothetical protein